MKKIWLEQYPQDVPHEINPDAYISLVELFQTSCEKFADKPALRNFGRTLTYKELKHKADAFTAFLQHKLKVKKGDRIALMLPNVLQHPICFFGALQAGLIIINVNPLYTTRELIEQLSDCGAETIVVLVNFAQVLQHALPETKINNVIITETGDLCGLVKSKIINFVTRKKTPTWDIPRAIPLLQALKQGRKQKLHPVKIKGNNIALLQYTGGTTGISKGAILTHRNLIANVEQNVAWMSNKLQQGKEIAIAVLPLYHIFGLTVCCLTFMRMGAFSILITNPRNISNINKILAKNKISVFIGLNSIFNALLNTAAFKKLDFSALKLVVAGGMAVQNAVATKWKKITGSVMLEGYGLTEASPVVSMSPLTQTEFSNNIGLPVSSTDISIRDKTDKELTLGEPGELCVKGPQIMRGYWQRDDETKLALSKDGWLRTGDIALMDEKGFLYIVDRKKDMIVTNGYNVYPNEIENVIMMHPEVTEVAVIGVPSKHAGEIVKAFIVRKDESLTKEKTIAFCKDRMVGYKIPKRIEFKDELPKSNVGKILRRALKEK